MDLIAELRVGLAKSDARKRKYWARWIIDEHIPLESFFSLWHEETQTAQRFMWLIGDLVDMDPSVVEPNIEFLFALRDEVSFPGMHRSVAKWLLRTDIPEVVETQAIKQLRKWLGDPSEEIGCKHYSAHALFNLVKQARLPVQSLKKLLEAEVEHPNPAYAGRSKKMLDRLPV